MSQETLSKEIEDLAYSLGIDAIGFSNADGFLQYKLRSSTRRDPKLSLPNASSIIVAGIYIGGITLPIWNNYWYGRTSRLYLSSYFLDVVKPLRPIAQLLSDNGYQARICDGSETSILPLKLAAIRAGLGWQGKNSLLLSKKYGSFLALGGIITDAKLEWNLEEENNHCGTCNLCQKACPLGALKRPYELDKKNCLSYQLQIENLPGNTQAILENRIGDCEICQQVCPWNRKHINKPLRTKETESFENKKQALSDIFYLPTLIQYTEKEYKEKLGFLNTDIDYDIFQRNVSIALSKATEKQE
jgi:epoxyqueuosine reductase